MTKFTFTDIATLTNAPATINGIVTEIEEALDTLLSRDGTTPNQMTSDLDMNSNHILNLPTPVAGQEPVRLQDISALTPDTVTVADVLAVLPDVHASSIAALRTITVDASRVVTTLGYYNSGDGGGGQFRGVTGAAPGTYVENGGTVILPTGGNGSSAWVATDHNVATGQFMGEVLSVKRFGAKGDGVTDDTAAIQDALDYLKPSNVMTPTTGQICFVPSGTYIISSAISVYSSITIYGVGLGSILKASAGFTDAGIFVLYNVYPDQYRFGFIDNLYFDTALSPTIWAITSSVGFVLQSKFSNLTFNGGYCLNLSVGYTQSNVIDTLYSAGSLEQILAIYGNRNWISNIDKEAGTGTSTDPYILIKGCSNCTLDNILLEGTCSSNKVGVLITDNTVAGVGNRKSSVWMRNCWFEMTGFVGNAISVENGCTLHLDGDFTYFYAPNQLINVEGASTLYLIRADTSPTDTIWSENVILDATSRLLVDHYVGRHLGDAFPLTQIDAKVRLNHASTAGVVLADGVVNNVTNVNIGANLLVNPSFEAGIYGWTVNSLVDTTLTYPASTTTTGLMLDVAISPTNNRLFTQNVVISADMVGQPLTFSAVVKLISGDANAFVAIYANGAGVSTYGNLSRATIGSGWQLVTQTFSPQAAGTMAIGFYCVTAGHIQIDECFCGFGTVGTRNHTAVGSIDFPTATIVFDTAAPATGTWKVGSKCFNSAPAVGQPKGWVCTVAGSPGTWVSEGNL